MIIDDVVERQSLLKIVPLVFRLGNLQQSAARSARKFVVASMPRMKTDWQNNNTKNRWALGISVKSEKDSTSTLSLVIYHRVRLKKRAKKCISIKGELKLRKPSILMVPEFHPIFHSTTAPP
jgi:hypothetical protein